MLATVDEKQRNLVGSEGEHGLPRVDVLGVGTTMLGPRPHPLFGALEDARLRDQPFGPYLLAADWDPDVLLARLSAKPAEIWGPGDPRRDGDLNTDLFPMDEYFLNNKQAHPLENTSGH